jgi:hypothetical protein
VTRLAMTTRDAVRGPVGLPTRKGATRTPSLPNARSSRASVGDDSLDDARRRAKEDGTC